MFSVTNYAGFATGRTVTVTPPLTGHLSHWYDFSDQTQLGTSGTFITSINDKGTASATATSTIVSTNTFYPSYASAVQNGLGAARYPQVRVGTTTTFAADCKALMAPITEVINGTLGDSVVAAVSFNGTLAPGNPAVFAMALAGDPSNFSLDLQGGNPTGTSTAAGYLYGQIASLNAPGSTASGWHILSGVTTRTGTETVRFDGGAASATHVNGGGGQRPVSTGGSLYIGNGTFGATVGGASFAWEGYIGEMRIFTTRLGTDDLYKEEGYLAWKWGLQGNLPSDHPYKNAPP